MRKLPILFILLFGQVTQVHSQEIVIKKHDDFNMARLLNTLELIGEKKTSELSSRIYFMANLSGSAGYPTSEVTHNILIAVSEYDELPEQSSFEISAFYNPKLIEYIIVNDRLFKIKVEYGPFNSRKEKQFQFSLNNIEITDGS